jgi:hypothetical protein
MAGNIPPPNIPLVDPRGYVSMEWYRWLSRKEADIGPGEIETTGGLAGGGSTSSGLSLSIAPKGVTDAKLRDSAPCSVIGRFQNSDGPPTDIKAMDNDRVLMRLDDVLVFKQLSATLVGAQPDDATLTALAALDATAGLVVQTGADRFTKRTLAAPAAGITISNPAGTAGNPTFALGNDLAALEALSGTSTIYYRSGVDTWSAVTVAASLGFSAGTLGSALGTAATLTFDTDGTFAANSDAKIATQKATKTYVDAAVTGVLKFKGSTDCSANPNYPAAVKGDSYVVTVAGKIGGASGTSVDAGDVYFATADNAGGTQASVGSSWRVLEHNLVGALLSANNLSDLTSAATARTNLGLVIGTNVQAWDADLDSWAAITRASGFDTFTATPTSANLRALLTDETGTGAAVFATSPTIATPTITGLIDAQGGQIKFPATQVPSADVNTLDDYEEGTFTPNITFGGGSTGISYDASNHTGRYTKIGRMVYFEATVVLTAKGSSTGAAQVTGLPFSGASVPPYAIIRGISVNLTSITTLAAYVTSSALQLVNDAGSGFTNVTDTNFSNTSQVYLSGCYAV